MNERELVSVEPDEAALDQLLELRSFSDEFVHGFRPERPSDHGACLERSFLGRGQQVDTCRQQCEQAVGKDQIGWKLTRDAAVGQRSQELLDEERVAVGAFDHGRPDVRREHGRGKLVDHAGCIGLGERVDAYLVALELHLGTRSGEKEQRAANPSKRTGDELQQLRLGPVQVLDENNCRLLSSKLVEETGPGLLQRTANGEWMKVRRRRRTQRETEDAPSTETGPHRLRRVAL